MYPNDANTCLDNFFFHYLNVLNKHAPLEKLSKKKISLRLKPWINGEIRSLMTKRDRLFRRYCNAKDPELKLIKKMSII